MAGNSWEIKNGKLIRRFKFDNFLEALEFVNNVGAIAEKENHHPDISFGWGYVEICLFTHDKDSVTEKDYKLASAVDDII